MVTDTQAVSASKEKDIKLSFFNKISALLFSVADAPVQQLQYQLLIHSFRF